MGTVPQAFHDFCFYYAPYYYTINALMTVDAAAGQKEVEVEDGTDFEADMQMMAADPVTQKWWATVKPLMQPLDTIKPGEFWADMDEIYYLD